MRPKPPHRDAGKEQPGAGRTETRMLSAHAVLQNRSGPVKKSVVNSAPGRGKPGPFYGSVQSWRIANERPRRALATDCAKVQA